jgi:hypothetical protein
MNLNYTVFGNCYTGMWLKEQCNEIFDPLFFHHQPHQGPWFTALGSFAIGIIFAEKIDNIRISAGSLTPLKLLEFYLKDFHVVIDLTVTVLAGSLTTLKRFQRGHWFSKNLGCFRIKQKFTFKGIVSRDNEDGLRMVWWFQCVDRKFVYWRRRVLIF